jgi:hypothetical protein
MVKTISSFLLLFLFFQVFSQEQPVYQKKIYVSPEGKLFINRELPVYLWLSTSPDNSSEKYRLWSEQSAKYSNPFYFDVEGYNSLRSPSAVDTSTHKTVIPEQDIVFEIYADNIAPVTKIEYNNTVVYPHEGKINLGGSTSIVLKAGDQLSGIENIYYSLDGAAYIPYKSDITFTAEKEYLLKYYAVDNVGNVEKIHEVRLVYDKSVPVTKLEIEGDKYEDILSGRAKIILKTEDAGTGIKQIYYSLDSGIQKAYVKPISTEFITQGAHNIIYFASDHVGNKELEKSYAFYVDKAPPTIIEEVIGNTFFSNGKEYSSGKSRLKLTSFDNKAGVKEVKYSVNGKEYQLYDKPVFLTQSSGNLDIKSYAVDNVNNRSISQAANEKTSIPYIDLSGPQLSHTFSGPVFNSRDTVFLSNKSKIQLKGFDPEAGMNHIEYTVNGSDPKQYTAPFSVENEGYSKIDFTGFDNVDNTSMGNFGFKVDNTGPEISFVFGSEPTSMREGISVYPSHAVIFLVATDRVVGFQKMTYKINNGKQQEYLGLVRNLPKGKNTITVLAYDQLGNTTEKEIQFIIE